MRKTYSNSHANRGVILERLLDMTNKQYLNKGIADIRKVPTPVKIISNKQGRVTGHVTKGEFVDYLGITNGRAVIFDAKETRETTRFPLDNLSRHQFDILKSWDEKGAHAFLLVSFTKKDEVYLLSFEQLQEAWTGFLGDGRKSIPYNDFVMNCKLVKSGRGYVLDYLAVV